MDCSTKQQTMLFVGGLTGSFSLLGYGLIGVWCYYTSRISSFLQSMEIQDTLHKLLAQEVTEYQTVQKRGYQLIAVTTVFSIIAATSIAVAVTSSCNDATSETANITKLMGEDIYESNTTINDMPLN